MVNTTVVNIIYSSQALIQSLRAVLNPRWGGVDGMSDLQVPYPAFRLKGTAFHTLKVSLPQVISILFKFVTWMTGKNGPSEILQLPPNSEDQETDFYKITHQRELYKQKEWADKL